MAYEHKEGQGSMFRNDKQNERQPDYKGTIVIGGNTYEIAAWERTSQRGTAFLSLQVSIPNEHSHLQSSQSVHKETFSVKDSDMPDSFFLSSNSDEDLPF